MYKNYTINDTIESSKRKLFTHISTFSGGGGSCIGVNLAGGQTLVANEFVETASETYLKNFPDRKVLVGDIKELTGEDFLRESGLDVGELDLFEGSPPCSAFSISGNKSSGWNKEKTYSDGKKVHNIEDLFFEFIRIANEIKPKVIIAENVVGLTVGESKKYLNKIINSLSSIGYEVTYKILDASLYGTPQRRCRVIFLCIREDIANIVGINQFNIQNIYPEGKKDKSLSFGKVMEDVNPDKYGDLLYLTDKLNRRSPDLRKYISIVVDEKLNEHKNVKLDSLTGTKYFNYCVYSYNDIPNTITQRGLQIENFIHPSGKRPITTSEACRIMGLPDDYMFTGSIYQNLERVGRMVAPKMYEALCNSIYDKVLK